MSLSVKTFQDTPNPNALKCILSGRIVESPRSYFTPESAAQDPLASRLFAIAGVSNLLIHPEWITVGKRPDADWKPIKSALQKILYEAP